MSPPADFRALTQGQRLAADQLAEIADRSDGAVEILRGPSRPEAGQSAVIDIALDCTGLAVAPAGLRLRACGVPELGHQPELGFYAARSYSLMRPPRTGRRWIRFRVRSATG